MDKDCQRALEPSFTYGYGCCVFKHNIYRDQLEVLDCMPDSPNFHSPECLASLRCPPVSASSEDAAIEVHYREVVEESGRGAPLGDLNEHPHFLFLYFFYFLFLFFVITLMWPLFFFLIFP